MAPLGVPPLAVPAEPGIAPAPLIPPALFMPPPPFMPPPSIVPAPPPDIVPPPGIVPVPPDVAPVMPEAPDEPNVPLEELPPNVFVPPDEVVDELFVVVPELDEFVVLEEAPPPSEFAEVDPIPPVLLPWAPVARELSPMESCDEPQATTADRRVLLASRLR